MKNLKAFMTILLLKLYAVWIKIKWSPYNPWAMAFLNSAYKKYEESPLYKFRQQFIEELKKENFQLYEQNKDFVINTFIASRDMFIFMKKLTLKDKLLAIIAPFSINGPFGKFSNADK